MPRVRLTIKFQSGFSTVEALLAVAIFGFLTVAVVGSLIYGRASTADSSNRAIAVELAEEGLEAVRNIRDNQFSNLADGTYGLVQSGGTWTLSGTQDTTNSFTRSITLSTPSANHRTAQVTVTWPKGGNTGRVSLSGTFSNWRAYLATWTQAVLTGSYDAAGTRDPALKAATKSHYVYLVRATGSPNFLVIDVADPAGPKLVGSLTLPGSPSNLSINGNNAYVSNSNGSSQLQTVDISNPLAPQLLSTYNCPGKAGALSVASVPANMIYLVRAANGGNAEFCIVNASNPAQLTLAGQYNNNISMNDIYISGSHAYIVTSAAGQALLDMNIQQAAPAFVSATALPGKSSSLAIDGYGSLLFVGNGPTVYSFDTSSSGPPAMLDSVGTSGGGIINDITTDPTRNFVFLATNARNAQFQVVNAHNPANLLLVRVVSLQSDLNGIVYVPGVDGVAGATSGSSQELTLLVKG